MTGSQRRTELLNAIAALEQEWEVRYTDELPVDVAARHKALTRELVNLPEEGRPS